MGELEAETARPATAARVVTVGELVAAYVQHGREYYGPQSQENTRIASAVRNMQMYAAFPVTEFDPPKLKRVIERTVLDGDTRKEMVAKYGHKPISRATINDYTQVLQRMFKWAVSEKLMPVEIQQALATVSLVRKGRGKLADKCAEPRKIEPANPQAVTAVVKEAQPEIATMIQVQLLCGMRPDEVTIMRPCDIDTTLRDGCWTYTPTQHKNSHRAGREREEIYIGPKAQKLLTPWIEKTKPGDFLFSPRRVSERWNAEQAAKARKGKNSRGTNGAFAKLNQEKPPRDHYDDHSYRQAVKRICKRLKVDHWTPNQLRHGQATTLRALYGIEAAKLVLRHRHLSTTEMYAEKDKKRAREIVKQVG
jgi:integrase